MNFNKFVDLIQRRFRFYVNQWSVVEIHANNDLSKLFFVVDKDADLTEIQLICKRTLSDYKDIAIEVYSSTDRRTKNLRGFEIYTRGSGFND